MGRLALSLFMDCVPVASTELIRHRRIRVLIGSHGGPSRVSGMFSCDTTTVLAVDDVGDQRSPGTYRRLTPNKTDG